MPFTLSEVVPWGRTQGEYQRMFALGPGELAGRILGVGDGPASFNAETTAAGGRVVSVDPLYRFSPDQIAHRIDEVFDVVMGQTRANRDEFVWGPVVADPDHLARLRRGAMDGFLADYPAGLAAGRYRDGELPDLAWPDQAFDLALCSHFLFLYSQQLDLDFHLRSVRELCRVAADVRIFPLLQLGAEPSPHLEPVVAALAADPGLEVAVEAVDYEFQRGGDRMLHVRRRRAHPGPG